MRKVTAALLATGVAALVVASMAFAATATITKSMSGSAEVPKGSPTGKGTAKVTLNSSTGRVCFRLTWSGIGTPVAAHIHKGPRGKTGPVVIPFFGGTAKHTGCVKASKSLVGAIIRKPSAYYVNVHTQKYPAGALRAQL